MLTQRGGADACLGAPLSVDELPSGTAIVESVVWRRGLYTIELRPATGGTLELRVALRAGARSPT